MNQINLQLLQSSRDEIIKAEIVGLLHNIGKLDPNFLSSVVSEGGSKLEVRNQGQEIIGYSFSRFAIFDSNLLDGNIKSIVQSQPQWTDKNVFLNTANCLIEIENQLRNKASSPWDAIESALFIQEIRNANPTTIDAKKVTGRMPFSKSKLEALLDVVVYKSKNGPLTPILSGRNSANEETQRQQWETDLRQQTISVDHNVWPLVDLLTVFWDSPFFFKEERDDYKRQSTLDVWMKSGLNNRLPAFLALSHGEVSGVEKQSVTCSPKWPELLHSSAFGFEKDKIDIWNLASKRQDVITQLVNYFSASPVNYSLLRRAFIDNAKVALKAGVGDTQWPYNEITLWDYASSIAALFKSSVAKAVLENRLPTVAEVKWRLLSIRYDGLEYLSQAHHISDLLARRDALNAALDAVKSIIEVEYPLGNEIYRDEKGSVLLVPDVRVGEQPIELLAQSCGEEGKLKELLLKRFSAASYGEGERSAIAGEIKPIIALSDEKLGKAIKLTDSIGWNNPPLQTDPDEADKWWKDEKKHGELCTVCGLRPQGYGASDDRDSKTGKKGWNLHLEENHHRRKQPTACEVCKAIDRQICWVCMERRDDRAKKWATDPEALKRTIWMDEVADSNGRLALVVGRFVMEGWLDGQLIATMQKSDSFARIQRCWRTTLEFWQRIEKELPTPTGNDRKRKIFTAENFDTNKLGDYHVYDLDLKGRTISVVWDKANKYFITADNLEYFQKNGGSFDLPENKAVLFESSSHSKARTKNQTLTGSLTDHEVSYSPHIRILAQPALFMALVPADKALAVAREINEKYKTEMGKVRDRLPLHVGIVYAPRRTPVRALLEAGRKMLKMPDCWEEWVVQTNTPTPTHHEIKFDNGIEWKISAVMGDNVTPDQWYPHLLERKPTANEDLYNTKPWKHAKDVKQGDIVAVRPSRFDFEFLDTAGRRFEISYDDQCNRRGSATRPFLLEDLKKLDELWDLITKQKKLTSSHLQHLEMVLTSYITDWFHGDIAEAARCKTYQQFAKDTLHQLDAKWWKSLDEAEKEKLDIAITSGLIFDLLELRLHILKEKPKGETV